jgi:HPt (histidine-containing phosphotransfer) domain-containing protein
MADKFHRTMSEEKLYDMTFLNKISGGDVNFIREMVSTFKEVGPEYIITANDLLGRKDFSALGKETHRMIPGVSFLGAKKLESELMLIEEYTKKQTHLDEVPQLVEEVEKIILKLIQSLENDFSESK